MGPGEMDHLTGNQEARERYRELLEELRTIIPGVQVLFAFLLTVPFAARFASLDRFEKIIFMISLMTAAAATIMFLAPAAYHRLAGREDRRGRLRFGVRTSMIGMVLLAISITCAVLVVVRFLFSSSIIGAAMAVTIASLSLVMWYFIPVYKRWRSGKPSETKTQT